MLQNRQIDFRRKVVYFKLKLCWGLSTGSVDPTLGRDLDFSGVLTGARVASSIFLTRNCEKTRNSWENEKTNSMRQDSKKIRVATGWVTTRVWVRTRNFFGYDHDLIASPPLIKVDFESSSMLIIIWFRNIKTKRSVLLWKFQDNCLPFSASYILHPTSTASQNNCEI